MNEAKPFCISKKEVWEAYQRVKKNKGAAGTDDQSIEDFEKRLKKNLYKIWNRMSSGSYFPPPVRTVKIPKKNGVNRFPLMIKGLSANCCSEGEKWKHGSRPAGLRLSFASMIIETHS
jgi:RNA-directed DNA polymerase